MIELGTVVIKLLFTRSSASIGQADMSGISVSWLPDLFISDTRPVIRGVRTHMVVEEDEIMRHVYTYREILNSWGTLWKSS